MTTAALQYLTDMNIDTSNRIRAVQDAGALEFDANTYRKVMGELTGLEINVADDTARTAFLYTVQFAVEGQPIDIAYQAAVPKAEDYVAKHPWINAKPEYEYEPTSRVDALGAPKQKKGAKKEAAIALWNELRSDPNFVEMTRKEWIETLMEDVGLTTGAASTYHHNLKTGKWS